ncbi:MAG: AraC family transcriptional regulator [Lachnospiraceae bacterium]|nr:AraC family transcriptional regulator [Lachnospiraceae bacterium]
MELYYEHEADEIYVRHIREENADGNGYTMHIHERCEIYYFIDGNADYLVEGSEYRMKRGSLLVMRPGEVHRAKLLANGIYERYAVNFPISFFDDIDPERRLTNLYTDRPLGINNLYEKPELEYLFEQLCEDHTDEYDRRLAAYRILIEILSKLDNEFKGRHEKTKKEKNVKNSTFEKILKYVNGHIFDELSVTILAEKFYLSRSQIGRLFKQSIGASPWEYITVKRLIASREMLSSGMSAGETAEKCGFGDYSSFYRAYVKRYGESPKNNFS